MLLGKILIGIGCFLFLLSTAFFTVSIILNHFSMQTGRTRAVVKNQKHRKNVALYMQRFYKAPPTRVGTIKHLTRGTYEYTVGQKTYTIRENFIGTPRQAPIFITVVYLKKVSRDCIHKRGNIAFQSSLSSRGGRSFGGVGGDDHMWIGGLGGLVGENIL